MVLQVGMRTSTALRFNEEHKSSDGAYTTSTASIRLPETLDSDKVYVHFPYTHLSVKFNKLSKVKH